MTMLIRGGSLPGLVDRGALPLVKTMEKTAMKALLLVVQEEGRRVKISMPGDLARQSMKPLEE